MLKPKTTLLLVLGIALLNACGGGGSNFKGTIAIGADFPLTAADASDGVPTANGVRFAVKEQNDSGGIRGYEVRLIIRDDVDRSTGKHSAALGAANITALAADAKVLGVVGPLNSNVAAAEIPVANRTQLALISPADTNPCLTKDLPSCGIHPRDLRPGGINNYFRLPATDDLQGAAMADYAIDTLRLRKLAVLSDPELYGKGIAAAFAAQFKKRGGTLVKPTRVVLAATEAPSVLDGIKSAGADAIYFGGTPSTNACKFRAAMKGRFSTSTVFLGGDGLLSQQCLADADGMTNNMQATLPLGDASQTSAGKSIVEALQHQFPGANANGRYTAAAYVATQVLMQAIGHAIDDADGGIPSRQQVLNELARTDYQTVLGRITFDAQGDAKEHAISFYVTGGSPPQWQFVKQLNTA